MAAVIARMGLSILHNVLQFLGGERLAWYILGLAAFLLMFAQAPRTRLTVDPVVYAAIARTMADSGDYLNLKLGDEPYYKKPPLQFWLAAATTKLFGPTVLPVTLFSRIFGLGCVFLTVWLAHRLYGASVAWMAGLALTTTYIFVRGSATFRLDSALTFGILLALAAYLSSPKAWATPIFYLGVGVAVLSKGPPGLLPLLVAPIHAWFTADSSAAPKRWRVWLAWAPLLLIPLGWWVYLLTSDGLHPFKVLFDDLLRTKPEAHSRLYGFWMNYVGLAFLSYYWPWLPFALVGARQSLKDLIKSPVNKNARSSAVLLLAWIGIASLSAAIKSAQYPRYVFFMLPAVSIMTARGFIKLGGDKYLEQIRGIVGILAIMAAFLIAGLAATAPLGPNEQFYAIAEIINNRLPPKAPLAMLKLKVDRNQSQPKLSPAEKATAIFFFDRQLRLVSIDELRAASIRQRMTLLVRNDEITRALRELPMEILFNSAEYAVAEVPRGISCR
jgi:4-amino-4-deoxy-L-arabinose transferase-like glycosyltransferase